MDHERCEACGFDGAGYDPGALRAAWLGLATRWRAQLREADDLVRTRPAAGVWSAVEYAAHSRDITALHAFGVEQALSGTEPVYPAIDDSLVDSAAATYAGDDPVEVIDELDRQACRIAELTEGIDAAAWTLGLTIGDERIEVRRLVEHGLHDFMHHLGDVDRGIAALRGAQRA